MSTIVSASRRTDIPAYYADWFMARLREGHCRYLNPFSRQWIEVDLSPATVGGIVFWTKNLGPLLPHLAQVRKFCPFYVQLTITGHPREVEPRVPEADRAVEQARRVSEQFGERALVWRFDPIVHTQYAGPEDTLARFERLADRLAGVTRECVISFMSPYRRQKRAFAEARLHWDEPGPQMRLELASAILAMARERGMSVAACCNPDVAQVGVAQARCIDAGRLRALGAALPASIPAAPSRPGCGCCKSTDIGAYDTCPSGCAYCYANSNPALAQTNHGRHRTDHVALAEAFASPSVQAHEGCLPQEG